MDPVTPTVSPLHSQPATPALLTPFRLLRGLWQMALVGCLFFTSLGWCAPRPNSRIHWTTQLPLESPVRLLVMAEKNFTVDWGDGVKVPVESVFQTECLGEVKGSALTVEGEDLLGFFCMAGGITQLDVSQCPTLTHLVCSDNPLNSLHVASNPALESVSCHHTQLSAMDVSHNPALQFLCCCDNLLTHLSLEANPQLHTLICDSNALNQLDLKANVALSHLICDNNPLGQLDLSHNPCLEALRAEKTQLHTLDLSRQTKLQFLFLSHNALSAVDLHAQKALKKLVISHNALTTLDLCNQAQLTSLTCDHNRLHQLDLASTPQLTRLECAHNHLAQLDLTPAQNTLSEVDISDNPLQSLHLVRYPRLWLLRCAHCGLGYCHLADVPALRHVSLHHNGLTHAALEGVFSALPDISQEEAPPMASLFGRCEVWDNPGHKKAKKSLALKKGWTLDATTYPWALGKRTKAQKMPGNKSPFLPPGPKAARVH